MIPAYVDEEEARSTFTISEASIARSRFEILQVRANQELQALAPLIRSGKASEAHRIRFAYLMQVSIEIGIELTNLSSAVLLGGQRLPHGTVM